MSRSLRWVPGSEEDRSRAFVSRRRDRWLVRGVRGEHQEQRSLRSSTADLIEGIATRSTQHGYQRTHASDPSPAGRSRAAVRRIHSGTSRPRPFDKTPTSEWDARPPYSFRHPEAVILAVKGRDVGVALQFLLSSRRLVDQTRSKYLSSARPATLVPIRKLTTSAVRKWSPDQTRESIASCLSETSVR